MYEQDIITETEKSKRGFIKRQSEKNLYLGEYKERVIVALNKDEIIEDDIYVEIEEALKTKTCFGMKMARDIPLKKLKPYIKIAENLKVNYTLVDGISYQGEIGLIVYSEEALDEQAENLVIRDMDQDYIDAGLGEKFSKNRGKKICKDCFDELEYKMPEKVNEFKKINIFHRLMGEKCPICKN